MPCNCGNPISGAIRPAGRFDQSPTLDSVVQVMNNLCDECKWHAPGGTQPGDFLDSAYVGENFQACNCEMFIVCLGNNCQSTVYISFETDVNEISASDWITLEVNNVSIEIGMIFPYAGTTVPDGYLNCDGAAVSRTTYAALYSAIGTTWGVGDGSTTFNLPDFRGRALLGAGTGSGLSARALGDSGGAETHQLTENEMPSHTHGLRGALDGASVAEPGMSAENSRALGLSGQIQPPIESTGGNSVHNNMQPWAAITWMIWTGVLP